MVDNKYKYTNSLIHEQSPYLLQHAHNPVNWRAWNDETFAIAVREDKPIFLSIGYATCHWCHVMEHESFEDEEVAEVLNMNFISIKLDREERPDIDSVYMEVCQAMVGNGGWPNCRIKYLYL
ncbi:MAG: thioredoxin domain-containing protein [Ignavibacteriae bacterium]|nr:thioredoxin domain-containing protein [Ignavibacteriota bacterium]